MKEFVYISTDDLDEMNRTAFRAGGGSEEDMIRYAKMGLLVRGYGTIPPNTGLLKCLTNAGEGHREIQSINLWLEGKSKSWFADIDKMKNAEDFK